MADGQDQGFVELTPVDESTPPGDGLEDLVYLDNSAPEAHFEEVIDPFQILEDLNDPEQEFDDLTEDQPQYAPGGAPPPADYQPIRILSTEPSASETPIRILNQTPAPRRNIVRDRLQRPAEPAYRPLIDATGNPAVFNAAGRQFVIQYNADADPDGPLDFRLIPAPEQQVSINTQQNPPAQQTQDNYLNALKQLVAYEVKTIVAGLLSGFAIGSVIDKNGFSLETAIEGGAALGIGGQGLYKFITTNDVQPPLLKKLAMGAGALTYGAFTAIGILARSY